MPTVQIKQTATNNGGNSDIARNITLAVFTVVALAAIAAMVNLELAFLTLPLFLNAVVAMAMLTVTIAGLYMVATYPDHLDWDASSRKAKAASAKTSNPRLAWLLGYGLLSSLPAGLVVGGAFVALTQLSVLTLTPPMALAACAVLVFTQVAYTLVANKLRAGKHAKRFSLLSTNALGAATTTTDSTTDVKSLANTGAVASADGIVRPSSPVESEPKAQADEEPVASVTPGPLSVPAPPASEVSTTSAAPSSVAADFPAKPAPATPPTSSRADGSVAVSAPTAAAVFPGAGVLPPDATSSTTSLADAAAPSESSFEEIIKSFEVLDGTLKSSVGILKKKEYLAQLGGEAAKIRVDKSKSNIKILLNRVSEIVGKLEQYLAKHPDSREGEDALTTVQGIVDNAKAAITEGAIAQCLREVDEEILRRQSEQLGVGAQAAAPADDVVVPTDFPTGPASSSPAEPVPASAATPPADAQTPAPAADFAASPAGVAALERSVDVGSSLSTPDDDAELEEIMRVAADDGSGAMAALLAAMKS